MRHAIVKAFNDHGFTYVQIASLLGIGAATVSRTLRRYRETGQVTPKPRGPGRRSEIRGEVGEVLLNLVEQQPYATIEELHAQMVELAGIRCGLQAVRLALLRLGYLRKKSGYVPTELNRPDLQWKRHVMKALLTVVEPETLVFLDESSCNTSMAREYGWAPIGQRPQVDKRGGRLTTPTSGRDLRRDLRRSGSANSRATRGPLVCRAAMLRRIALFFTLHAALSSAYAEPLQPGMRKEDALEVCMSAGERGFLRHLRCSDGSAADVERSGSVGARRKLRPGEDPPTLEESFSGKLRPGATDTHIVDRYEVTCGKTHASVYFDMYHCDEKQPLPPQVAPPGMTYTPLCRDEEGLRAAERIEERALASANRGDFASAISPSREAATLIEKACGAEHERLGAQLSYLAMYVQLASPPTRDQPREVEMLAMRAAAILEKKDAHHADLRMPLTVLGNYYDSNAEDRKAAEVYQRALGVALAHPEDVEDIRAFRQKGAIALGRVGDFDTALKLLADARASDANDRAALALDDVALALVQKQKGDGRAAKSTAERALVTLVKLYGPDHPQVSFLRETFKLPATK